MTYRDVIVLDAGNEVASVYSLTSNDLAVAANREQMKTLPRAAAAR